MWVAEANSPHDMKTNNKKAFNTRDRNIIARALKGNRSSPLKLRPLTNFSSYVEWEKT